MHLHTHAHSSATSEAPEAIDTTPSPEEPDWLADMHTGAVVIEVRCGELRSAVPLLGHRLLVHTEVPRGVLTALGVDPETGQRTALCGAYVKVYARGARVRSRLKAPCFLAVYSYTIMNFSRASLDEYQHGLCRRTCHWLEAWIP